MNNISVILLAAGQSVRMGKKNKLLLRPEIDSKSEINNYFYLGYDSIKEIHYFLTEDEWVLFWGSDDWAFSEKPMHKASIRPRKATENLSNICLCPKRLIHFIDE